MSVWRRKAIEFLSELKTVIEAVDSPMALWIELNLTFEDAFKRGENDIIKRTLSYASWCFSPNAGKLPNDTSTAVVCAFYEHLGQEKHFWPYFKTWFTPKEFEDVRDCFRYFLSDNEFKSLEKTYYDASPKT